jgi:hypothetical protein
MRQQIPIDVKDPSNRPIPNALVTVRRSNNTLAVIYDGQEGPEVLANPQRTDRYGRIAGWLEDGVYEAEVVAAGYRNFNFDFRIVSSDFQGPEGPPGRDGLPGPPGTSTGGDRTYVHIQITPSNSWTVNHGLVKYPAVDVIDSAGTRIDGYEVTYVDYNTLTLSMGVEFAGRAICN